MPVLLVHFNTDSDARMEDRAAEPAIDRMEVSDGAQRSQTAVGAEGGGEGRGPNH